MSPRTTRVLVRLNPASGPPQVCQMRNQSETEVPSRRDGMSWCTNCCKTAAPEQIPSSSPRGKLTNRPKRPWGHGTSTFAYRQIVADEASPNSAKKSRHDMHPRLTSSRISKRSTEAALSPSLAGAQRSWRVPRTHQSPQPRQVTESDGAHAV